MAPATLLAALVVWLVTYAIHSTLLLGGVRLWVGGRSLSPSFRDTLWKAALLGGLLTATLAALLHAAGWRASLTGDIALPLPGIVAPSWTETEGPSARNVSWPLVVVALWALGALLGVLHLAAGQRRFVRSLGPRRPVMGPLAARLRELRLGVGLCAPVRLTTSPHIEGPAALSALEICLPERALRDLDAGEQEGVLAHELGHIARGDVGWRFTALLLERIFFFQPLHRAARRDLSDAAEFLADDWAVGRTRQEMPLARCLAAVAEWLQDGARPALATEMAARDSALLRRVERLVGDRSALREASRRRRRGAALCALVAVSLLAPGVAPRRAPRSAPPPEAPLVIPAAFVAPLPDGMGGREAGWRIRVVFVGGISAPYPRGAVAGDGLRPLRAPRARQVIRLRTGYLAWS